MYFARDARTTAALLLVAAAAIPGCAGAQGGQPAFGLYAGFNNSTMKGDSVPGPLSKNGFLGGVFLTWPLGDNVALQPEIVFAPKGVTTLDARPAGIVSTDIRVNYVEVPVLLRWSGPQMNGSIVPYLLAGPQVAVKAGCTVVAGGISGHYTCADIGSIGNVSNGVEGMDFGAIAGAGIDFRIGARRYTVSARYDYGLHNVVKNNDAKNRTFGVVAGLVW
jgi:hypothetical protein